MTPQIVPLYAGLFGILFVALSVRTLLARRKYKIAIGDGGDQRMLRAMRVHSTFAEYVPISLLLFLLVELRGAALTLLHGPCAWLLLGRISHAYGVSQATENYAFRVAGMVSTFTPLLIASGYLLRGSLA